MRRCVEAGLSANGPPLRLGAWSVVYVNDDQGFSVELLHVEPWYERRMGFRPRPTPRLAPLAGRTPARLRGERRFAKALVTGAAGGLGTELAGWRPRTQTSLVLVDRDADGLSRLAAELGDGAEVATLQLDLADLEAVDAATAELVAEHPDIDLLIAAPASTGPSRCSPSTGDRRATTSASTRWPTWCCSRIWPPRWPGTAAAM